MPERSGLKEGGLVMAPGFGGLSPKLADAIMSHSGPVAQQGNMVTRGQGHGQHNFCYIVLSHPSLAKGTKPSSALHMVFLTLSLLAYMPPLSRESL